MIILLDWSKIDDPVGCIGVHCAGGFWGMIYVDLFAQKTPGILNVDGIFRGGDGKMLGYNIAAAIIISAWSGGLTAILVSHD